MVVPGWRTDGAGAVDRGDRPVSDHARSAVVRGVGVSVDGGRDRDAVVTERWAPIDTPSAGGGGAGARRRRPGRAGRRLSERFTVRDLVGVVLALLALVLTSAVLRDRREMTTGLVPVERIPAGAVITGDMVEVVEFPASVPFGSGLVAGSAVTDGLVAGRVLEPGEPLTRSAVGDGESRRSGRVMSIPIGGWGEVGGELVVGDQIDVIDTRAAPVYVVSGAVVVDRATGDGSGGALSASTRLWVAIEVTGGEALELAGVIDAGRFVIVRSTGAEPLTPDTPTGDPTMLDTQDTDTEDTEDTGTEDTGTVDGEGAG